MRGHSEGQGLHYNAFGRAGKQPGLSPIRSCAKKSHLHVSTKYDKIPTKSPPTGEVRLGQGDALEEFPAGLMPGLEREVLLGGGLDRVAGQHPSPVALSYFSSARETARP